jgi:FkbM family methyltransferase
VKLEFPPEFDFVKQDLDNLGVWEKRTTEFVKKHLKQGQLFLDVGAQVGYYSVLASELGAEVIAFEPSVENRAYLTRNAKGNVTIRTEALSNKKGNAKLFIGKTPGENSLKENYHNDSGSEEVVLARYDDLNLGIPNMIKMDIEGGEQDALEGMEKVLDTDQPLILILEDWHINVSSWLIETYGFHLVTTDRASGNVILCKNQTIPYEEEPIKCHLLGTFNSPNTLGPEGIGNAFGTKVINMAKILKKLGHYVIFYGVEGSDVPCDEFVQVSTKKVLDDTYGKWDGQTIYKEDYGDHSFKIFEENCIFEINKRKRAGDMLLLCHGTFHKSIADAVGIQDTIEIGIGHRSSFARFRIFESEFQRAWVYGREDNDLNTNPMPGDREKGMGDFYDCVIPGFFDPKDFTYSDKKDDYFLYLGRIIKNKGIYVAQQICEKLQKPLKVAGFYYGGDKKWFDDFIKMPYVEYVGFADYQKRRELMSKAKALFLPTLYLEPFGYVVLEANLSGTPVITTDFGGFTETVKDGYNGYRCRTFKEFCDAATDCWEGKVSSKNCRKWGLKYTLNKTAPMYKRYLNSILNLAGKGWYN